MSKIQKIWMSFLIGIISIPLSAQDYTISILPFSSDKYDEFSPVYYKGDIVFCTNRKNSSLFDFTDEKKNLPLLDIYRVEEIGRNAWGKAELFSKKFRSHFNEGPATFNNRGSEIYFSRNIDIKKKIGKLIDRNNKLGIYYSRFNRRKEEWSNPTPFRYNNAEYNIAHPSLSEDGNSLYFVSDMDGGYGGTDLYVCELENGVWGAPQNLGSNINTTGNEYFPFVHSSGRLYFSSDEHESIGRLDIFYSEQINGEWHKPIHMDAPINSKYNDFGFIIDAFKKTGMFCSDRQRTSDDIYSFTPLYPMFDNSKRQEENDYCYVLYEEGTENPDSSILEYEWSFGDGKKARGLEVEHCFNGPGDFTLELNVIDKLTGEVFYTQATYPLKIEDLEQVYINAPDTVEVGQEIFFDGHKTNINNFKIYKYYWDFGDGRKTRGIEARHIYTTRGNYIVQLGVVSKQDKAGDSERTGVYKNIVVVGALKERNRRGNN
ncbi:MAG: PKD domain-containing protein [Bacteroidales bacterium]|nr:PKD domain-containing protein [Bacteroidales bacterium]